MDQWRRDVLSQLESRNTNFAFAKSLVTENNNLAALVKKLKLENEQHVQARSVLQLQVSQLEERSKSGIVQSSEDITNLYKQMAEDGKQLLQLKEELKQAGEREQTQQQHIDKLVSTLDEKQENIQSLEKENKSKEGILEVLKSDISNIQIHLVKTEEAVKQVKKENKSLRDRWMKKVEDDVKKMEELNKLYEELQQLKRNAVLQPQTPQNTSTVSTTNSTSGSSLLDSPKVNLGTSVVPKSSRKYIQAHQGEAQCVAFSNTGSMFVTGGIDKVVKIWDTSHTSVQMNLSGPEKAVTCVAFSPNDELVLAASNDKAARIWTKNIGRIRHSLLGHTEKVTTAQFSWDSERVLTGSHDRSLKIWDLHRGYCQKTIYCFSYCNDLCISRDATTVVTGHHDQHLRFWDIKSGECIHDISNLHSGQITSVSLCPDGYSVLTNARDNTLKVIDIRTYETLKTLKDDSYKNSLSTTRACWSPDGRYAASGSSEGVVCVWDVESSHCTVLKKVHKNKISCVAWSPNGYQIASVDLSGFISLWG
eukprot:TRINITY_DN1922_c0_g1_i1.p1 TRINITY_DN1922_c0_g1~~TRINITY_DN1922_c0_g1_i1.p1  ORF type:complete len:535 (-),score=94.98 TRINITY_DN1922_c0_g1_i1:31-1635(-)